MPRPFNRSQHGSPRLPDILFGLPSAAEPKLPSDQPQAQLFAAGSLATASLLTLLTFCFLLLFFSL